MQIAQSDKTSNNKYVKKNKLIHFKQIISNLKLFHATKKDLTIHYPLIQ